MVFEPNNEQLWALIRQTISAFLTTVWRTGALAGKIPAEAYQLYRATSNFVSPDGKTVQFLTGLTAGDPGSTEALNAVPAMRGLRLRRMRLDRARSRTLYLVAIVVGLGLSGTLGFGIVRSGLARAFKRSGDNIEEHSTIRS